MDFEMNQIDNSHPDELKICKNEIIEIGAVKLDDTYKEIDSFKTYVKPGNYACDIQNNKSYRDHK